MVGWREGILVAGAGFWRLLILMDELVVEVRRGAGGAVVATANVCTVNASRIAPSSPCCPETHPGPRMFLRGLSWYSLPSSIPLR